MTLRSILQKFFAATFAIALVAALARPVSAQMVINGEVIGVTPNTVTVLDANGNEQTFFVDDSTSGLMNLENGEWVHLSVAPTTSVVRNVVVTTPVRVHHRTYYYYYSY